MRTTIFLVAAFAGAAIAQPHGHNHLRKRLHQHQKRDKVVVYKNVVEQACRLTGRSGARDLDFLECVRGLRNGTFEKINGQKAFLEGPTTVVSTIIEVSSPLLTRMRVVERLQRLQRLPIHVLEPLRMLCPAFHSCI
jgi:hypothetical protein